MRIEKMNSGQHNSDRNVFHTAILMLLASGIGIYLLVTTVLIARDGITFIKYAQNLVVSPISTMLSQDQHPGYPFMILAAHKIAEIIFDSSSLWGWIYSAQIVTVLFKILSIVVIYFIGKEIVGHKFGFLAVLLLILLPKPARYGSDALSDWPHIFFLTSGFLMLLRGAANGKWRFFVFAGLAAGLGYLIRPECAQIVVFGSFWLMLQLFRYSRIINNKRNAAFALIMLFSGFLLVSSPYMKLKGAIFPKKHVGLLVSNVQTPEIDEEQTKIIPKPATTGRYMPLNIAKALGVLAGNIGETLMWFFVPALLAGLYGCFKNKGWINPKKFFTLLLIITNVPLLVWLYCRHGYISERHTLPLVVFTIFYIPVGLEAITVWLGGMLAKKTAEVADIERARAVYFRVLFFIGISICIPKLFEPLHNDKQGYLQAAQWLSRNTNKSDSIAVPDLRIGFYAERQSVRYDNETVPAGVQYAVQELKNKKLSDIEETLQQKVVFSIPEEKNRLLVIYKNIDY